MTTAETFQAWATGAVAITTAVAIVLTGSWALWRYVLPGPFGCAWQWEVRRCTVRLLPSGRYVYMIDMTVKNASSAMYTILRVAVDICFPNGETLDEVRRKELSLPEADSPIRCPPRVQRLFGGSEYEIDALHHVAFVVWRIQYRGPWLLGLFGQREDTVQHAIAVPVEAQSLALYVEPRSEEQP